MATASLRIDFAADLAKHGDRPALVAQAGTVSYDTLAERVASARVALGHPRRLVAVVGANRVDTIVWYLAALAGAHPVLLLPENQEHADHIIDAYDPDVLVDATSNETKPMLSRHDRSVHELHPDLALLMSTSGSTGSPKLVRLSHENITTNAAAIATSLSLRRDDRAITSLPMYYCYGLSVLHSHLAVGASIVLSDKSVVDTCFWDEFRQHGGTNLAGVPHTFDLLDRAGFDEMEVPTLRFVTQAGGRLDPEAVRRYAALGRRRGWELFVMYGQTEATARIAYLPPRFAASHATAIGRAVPGGTLTIEPVHPPHPADDVGELVYRGPNVMLGYAETAADLAAGRVTYELRTGDLGRRTEAGLFEISGRLNRFLKLYGLRIDLDAVEQALARRGIVALCTGDDTRLRIAVERPGDPATAQTIIGQGVGLPPTAIETAAIDVLPRLANGKLDRDKADRMVRAARRHDDKSVGSLAALYCAHLGVDRVENGDTFASLGGDSLSYVEMSVAIEGLLGHAPPDWHTVTIAELASTPPPSRKRRRLETSIVLRAVAITMIVGNHAVWSNLPGSAHVLIAIAGFNFARFQLRTTSGQWRPIARIAAPSVIWIGGVAALTSDYRWTHGLLVHSIVGAPGTRSSYWFIETLLSLLIPLTALFAVPAVRRLEQSRPLATPLAVAAIGLAIRFDLIPLPSQRHHVLRPQEVLWIFAIGWAAVHAGSTRCRLLLSALTLTGSYGFFVDHHRNAVLALGILLMLWVPAVPVPKLLRQILVPIASASLFIYLVHWQVLPALAIAPRPVAVAAGLAAGILAWRAWDALVGLGRRWAWPRLGTEVRRMRTAPS